MRSEARVVIIGGGIAGCSTLYHLTKLGWPDVVLLEANELTSGSTWHAAGLCTQMIGSWNLMKALQYSIDLYKSLESETGQAVDYRECGSLRLALTCRPPKRETPFSSLLPAHLFRSRLRAFQVPQKLLRIFDLVLSVEHVFATMC